MIAVVRFPHATRRRWLGVAAAWTMVIATVTTSPAAAQAAKPPIHPHFDHAPIIPDVIDSPQAVTRLCLSCHPKAVNVMATPHWLWLGDEVQIPGRTEKLRIGKRNLVNNFCISATGNERSCTKCHAGYGWSDSSFDFKQAENIDCLVCHERSGSYVKGTYGLPEKATNLALVAKSVGTPTRENCTTCHAYGGGGLGVKHGDLDTSLLNPSAEDDVHMGRAHFLCVDCHKAPNHQIQGRAFSVSVEGSHGVACEDCHKAAPHADMRLNGHLKAVACQTCHIPTYARKQPTKTAWDWSKAGDAGRPEDPHHYLKIKGEFVYDQDVVPEYRWFNRTTGRYLFGDPIDPNGVTALNPPNGDLHDPKARIWPFKVHRAVQPFDRKFNTLLAPVTGGPDGYWTNFNWDNAFKLGAKVTGEPYSGSYGFAKTEMMWPLSHMVSTREKALGCVDCHGPKGRLDWRALGYDADPISNGGRR